MIVLNINVGFKLKKKVYIMYKNLKILAVENENYHVYSKLFHQKTKSFKLDPRKLQEPRNKQNRIKEN